ncbi:hypothetical protein LY76DRAFT_593819 [Colletotrichum caudatum]|nr:hypothetical protein LY76DRAFT_593819 [Colletotrichum caudatum]
MTAAGRAACLVPGQSALSCLSSLAWASERGILELKRRHRSHDRVVRDFFRVAEIQSSRG